MNLSLTLLTDLDPFDAANLQWMEGEFPSFVHEQKLEFILLSIYYILCLLIAFIYYPLLFSHNLLKYHNIELASVLISSQITHSIHSRATPGSLC